MNKAQDKEEDIKFSMVVGMYDVYNPYPTESQRKRRLHYKSIANKIAHYIANNVQYSGDGSPTWNDFVEIYDEIEVIHLEHNGDVGIYKDIVLPNTIGPIMYIVTAMQRAVNEMKIDANQWMTPSEVEKFCDLKPGVVRKHVFDHRNFVESNNLVKKADGRTLLIKRGYALNRWGKHGQEKK